MITADSNIFLYLYDDRSPQKQATAGMVVWALSERNSLVALQVIGEVQNVLRRKFKALGPGAAEAGVRILSMFETFSYSRSAVERALGHLSAGRFSYWDALLLMSAEEAGCTVLMSEDMQSGARLGNIEIVNPFAPDGTLSAGARALLDL